MTVPRYYLRVVLDSRAHNMRPYDSHRRFDGKPRGVGDAAPYIPPEGAWKICRRAMRAYIDGQGVDVRNDTGVVPYRGDVTDSQGRHTGLPLQFSLGTL